MHELDVQPRKKVGIIGLIIGAALISADQIMPIICSFLSSLLGVEYTLCWVQGPLTCIGLAIVIISLAVIIYPIIRHILGYGSVR